MLLISGEKGSKWGDATSQRSPYNIIILMWSVENFTS